MKTNSSVLVIGSANADLCVKVDRLPRPGETILGGKFASAPGGKGANQAVAAARAGADVIFIGKVGRDAFGEQAVAGLKADGVNMNYLLRDGNAQTGVALIFIDARGENSIAVAPGSNAKLTPADLRKARAAFSQARILLLQLETPLETVHAAVEMAGKIGLRVVLNPAPAQMLPPEMLRSLFLLTPNKSEAELLTGIKLADQVSVAKAADVFLARGVQNVVITLGVRGAYVAGKHGSQWIPSYAVKAVDSTAAGDVFNGVLCAALAEGKSLFEAAGLANAAAAISVTRLGAQPSAPSRAEIVRMLGASSSSTAARRNGHVHSVSAKRVAPIER